MTWVRDVIYAIGLACLSPIWGWALVRTGKWRTDWAGRFGRVNGGTASGAREGASTLVIHGVSVGEVSLIKPLVDQLLDTRPDLRIIVAATTNTGIARARQLYADRLEVVRYPLDLSFALRRWLQTLKPDVLATVELEVWPNMVQACASRGVPVAVINGRISERSYRGYRWLKPVLASTFKRLHGVAAQSPDIAQRFRAMGTAPERVRVIDTMKWDAAQPLDEATRDASNSLADELGIDRHRPIVVAGSTAPGEEVLLLNNRPAGVQLVIAPRRPEWFERVMQAAPQAVRRTQPATPSRPAASDVFLLDTIGELRAAYAFADVVIVGRSFVQGFGGSDMMEPAGMGKPVIVGPHYRNFTTVMDALRQQDAVLISTTPMPTAMELLADAQRAARLGHAGAAVCEAHRGGTTAHADMLLALLDQAARPISG